MPNPKWLEWGQKLQALSQNGLTYTENVFDIDRYHKMGEIALEILSTYSQVEMPVIKAIFDSQAGYTTPKLDVRGVVFKEDKILMVKELSDGGWTLPGGFVDVNEAPGDAVAREVLEESGYVVKANKLMAVFDRNKHPHPPYIFHIYKLFFMCDLLGGAATTSIETGGAEFFDLDKLPELSTARTTFDQIQRCFDHHTQPQLPTDFD
jgi:ADP-ribose pyrophosphatase YjhB (NUDIX family)